jgi:N-acetylglucosaminyldiphosphoundecaprenol N-acetyl-beta-D-mannosaminyltransferase
MIMMPSIADPEHPTTEQTAARIQEAAGTTPSIRAWPISLLGVPFDNVTKAEAVARIEAMIASRRPHYVVTANVDFLVQARRDVELRRILLEADLVLCDGTPLRWASRWLGNPLPERAAGSDLVPLLICAAAEKGHRIFLLGAGPNVAAEAADRLQKQYPTLVMAGHYSPPFHDLLDMDFAEIAHRVKAARPDVLLVSFGCPKQEKWIAMHYHLLGVPVLIGVGATLDFMAGRIKRAPVFMQRTGTECIYRLAQEPRRLAGRYASDLRCFVPAIASQWWNLRAPPRHSPSTKSMTVVRTTDWQQIWVAGDFSAAALNRQQGFFDEALQIQDHCQLDLSQVHFLDSTGVAVLVQWRKRLHAHGKRFMLVNPSLEVQHTLGLMRLTGHFWIVAQSAGAPRQADAMQSIEPVIPPYPGGHTLAWQGEVIAANAEAVWNLTVKYLASVGPPPRQTFIIDLSRLQFIDSAGAALMKRLRSWARHLEKEMRFLGSRPDVCNVLRLAKLGDLLETTRR